MSEPLLEARNLSKRFPITAGFFRKVVGHIPAVSDVSFTLARGETLGLVGESGCGKTTTGRLVLRLIERSAGEIVFHLDGRAVNVAALHGEALRAFRKHMQLVFQNPFASLNPRMTVMNIIGEPLRAHGFDAKAIRNRVREVAREVGLDATHLIRYPHAFSGGQRQRICIARALALHPKLVICDEPVSALDVSVQAQILNLLMDLQERMGLTYLFIAHDLSVVEHISQRVAVMYAGRIVELAPTKTLFENPHHPYTVALMDAVPKPSPAQRGKRTLLHGEVADPSDLPSGCPFHPRCVHAQPRCAHDTPILRELGDGIHSACHFAETIFGKVSAAQGIVHS